MKYLDEHGAWMNFWMKIGIRRIIWMKLLVGWIYGWKWFQNSYDEWKLLESHNFHVQLHLQKKCQGETQRSYITMLKGEIITCVNQVKSQNKSMVGSSHNHGMGKCLRNQWIVHYTHHAEEYY